MSPLRPARFFATTLFGGVGGITVTGWPREMSGKREVLDFSVGRAHFMLQRKPVPVTLSLNITEPIIPDWNRMRTQTAKTSHADHPERASKVL